jgi:hypothetical protein
MAKKRVRRVHVRAAGVVEIDARKCKYCGPEKRGGHTRCLACGRPTK